MPFPKGRGSAEYSAAADARTFDNSLLAVGRWRCEKRTETEMSSRYVKCVVMLSV